MGSIIPRKKKDGTVSYTGLVRKRWAGGVHSESQTSTDKKFIELWMARREEAFARPGYVESLQHAGVSLADVMGWYLEDFKGNQRFGRTKLDSVRFLQRYESFAAIDAVNVTPADLIEHARRRSGEGAAPSTINNDFVWLRGAFESARLGRGVPLDSSVVEDAIKLLRREGLVARSKSRQRRPTLEELSAMLDWFAGRDGRATIPMVDIVLFALFSGRRQDEIVSLRWEDLDRRRDGVLVREMKHPRERIDTFVQLTERAWAVIDRQPKAGECIFPYKGKSVSGAFTQVRKILEIKDLRFHDLRHECASWLFELGWDIPRVAAVTGHRSWGSLQRYTHLREYGKFDKYEGWRWLPV